MFFAQRVEDNDFVHAVEELGSKMVAQLIEHRTLHALIVFTFKRASVLKDTMTADVRGHDDNRVLEVDGPPLAVGQSPIIEQLQQNVEDIVMGFFDFIEKDHAVRTAADRFRELSSFFEPDIAGRRAQEPGHGVLFLVFRHVDADHGPFIVERNSARARASSVLPTPVGPRKMKEPMGRLGSLRPERARTTASATADTASSWPTTRR